MLWDCIDFVWDGIFELAQAGVKMMLPSQERWGTGWWNTGKAALTECFTS